MLDNIFTNVKGAVEVGSYSIEAPRRVSPADHVATCEIDDSGHLFRIVSRLSIPNAELARLLGLSFDEESSLTSAGLTGVYRRAWRRTFGPFMPGRMVKDPYFSKGLYYTVGSEHVLSSMS